MSNYPAIANRLKEFLHFATKDAGGSITFGVQYDMAEQKWVGAMTAGLQKVTWPPGAGRKFIREMQERVSASTKDLTAQMAADLGAVKFTEIFKQMEQASKTAMERNAAQVRPEFFHDSGLVDDSQ